MKQMLEKIEKDLISAKEMYDLKQKEYLDYKKKYYEELYCKTQITEKRVIPRGKEKVECTLLFYIEEKIKNVFPILKDNNSMDIYYPKNINELKKCEKEPILNRYDIKDNERMLIHGEIYLNGESLIEMLATEVEKDKYKYIISDREDRIQCIEMYIAETESYSDRILMREDLAYLNSSSEEYVFEAVGTNGFVAKDIDIDKFNEICKDIINDNN